MHGHPALYLNDAATAKHRLHLQLISLYIDGDIRQKDVRQPMMFVL